MRWPDVLGVGRIGPAFTDPVHDAQACFRSLLDAMAHPGRIVAMAAAPVETPPLLGPAAAAVALTLCDNDTPVWLSAGLDPVRGYLTLHCAATFASHPAEARFAFVADPGELPDLDRFALGTDEYPDRSATLVIQVPGLIAGSGRLLRGPGIRGDARLDVRGLPDQFWVERAALAELFPCGLDMVFTAGRELAALPRSITVIG
ncbi:MAG: phosphonate C-P lyase system protein PhnH [Alphaproteobacteria bacterium]|nr:phosphonate C-P lyase system protein PhnH [Alphaproteobacteria bacterium]